MKVIVAPDSFKNNLTAAEVADWIAKGIQRADPSIGIRKIPMADGGEGTVAALTSATSGSIVATEVTGPLGEKTPSFLGLLGHGRTAVIEIAAAAGLGLVPLNQRNPLVTTTIGVGELIRAALDANCGRIIIGLGGSATNDGGIGMARALGVRFFAGDGRELPVQGGRYLEMIEAIDCRGLDRRLHGVELWVACDVKNPLVGPEGATRVYGPQKGATPEMVETLERGMAHYADLLQRSFNQDIPSVPGSGAAGGLGAGLMAYAGAKLKPGIELIADACQFEEELREADLLITGEGRTDGQTAYGKVPVGLAQIAQRHGVPVVCLSGGLGPGYEVIYQHGIDAAFSNVTNAMPLKSAMESSGPMLEETAYAIMRLIRRFR